MYPGCPELVASGYCAMHEGYSTDSFGIKRKPNRDPDTQKLYDRKWRQRRKVQLAEFPWCAECLDYKRYEPATDVHHVIPHKGNKEIFLESPLQSLCHACHSKHTRIENWDEYQVNFPLIKGMLAIPLIMVCGAPASGKSTYVEDHASQEDIIIDLDLIKSEISGSPKYFPVSKAILDKAIRRRNEALESLQFVHNHGQKAWFIVSAGKRSDRDLWKRILHPVQTIIMIPSKEECIDRIERDRSRLLLKYDQIAAVQAWFDIYYQTNDEIEVRGRGCEKVFAGGCTASGAQQREKISQCGESS
jgi:5-methylcytosine-specific restriction protein A